MTPENWVVGATVFFAKDYLPSAWGFTVKAGTKATVRELRTGFLGPNWSGTVALHVALSDGRILTDVPLHHLRH